MDKLTGESGNQAVRARDVQRDHECAAVSWWWQRSVIYQIYPRSFADSNGGRGGGVRVRVQQQWVERLDIRSDS